MQWFLDSGATDHMVKDPSVFREMRRLEQPVQVSVANGEKMVAEFCGDVMVHAVVGEKMKKCVVRNALYLPGLSHNLFSVNRVAKSGMQVNFAGDRADIVKNGAVMAVGHYTGRLYELEVWCECNRRKVVVAMPAGRNADAERCNMAARSPELPFKGKEEHVMKLGENQQQIVQSRANTSTGAKRRRRRSHRRKKCF